MHVIVKSQKVYKQSSICPNITCTYLSIRCLLPLTFSVTLKLWLKIFPNAVMLPTGTPSNSPNRAPEQYNTMDGPSEHAEHNQGLHEEENVNTDSASGLQENALVSSSSLSVHLCRVLIIKSRPIHLHVVSIARLGSSVHYLYPSQISKGTFNCSSVLDPYVLIHDKNNTLNNIVGCVFVVSSV